LFYTLQISVRCTSTFVGISKHSVLFIHSCARACTFSRADSSCRLPCDNNNIRLSETVFIPSGAGRENVLECLGDSSTLEYYMCPTITRARCRIQNKIYISHISKTARIVHLIIGFYTTPIFFFCKYIYPEDRFFYWRLTRHSGREFIDI